MQVSIAAKKAIDARGVLVIFSALPAMQQDCSCGVDRLA
jgi:hypothetical protein